MTDRLTHYTKRALTEFRPLVREKLFYLRGKMQDEITMRTSQGVFTLPTRNTGPGSAIYIEGHHEFDLSLRVVRFLRDNGFIPAGTVDMLDVGANIGHIGIGLLLAEKVRRAISVEPEPRNFAFLSKNVDQNGLSQRILCLQIALGEKPETMTMELSPDNSGDHRIRSQTPLNSSEREMESLRQVISIRTLPLDQVMKSPEVAERGVSAPALMWIDVQGHEGYVFKGASELLKKGLPTVSEVSPYLILRAGMTLQDFYQTVRIHWDSYWIDRRGRFICYPITVFDRYLEELGTEGYFENVIFTKGQPLHASPSG